MSYSVRQIVYRKEIYTIEMSENVKFPLEVVFLLTFKQPMVRIVAEHT